MARVHLVTQKTEIIYKASLLLECRSIGVISFSKCNKKAKYKNYYRKNMWYTPHKVNLIEIIILSGYTDLEFSHI